MLNGLSELFAEYDVLGCILDDDQANRRSRYWSAADRHDRCDHAGISGRSV